MATELLLHAKKEDFENLISQLEGKISELRNIAGEYQELKNNVNTFVQEGDSNFFQMCANVQNNVDAVNRGIALTTNARDNLQKTVDQMESFGSDLGNMMTETAEAASNVIKTAIRTDGLGL